MSTVVHVGYDKRRLETAFKLRTLRAGFDNRKWRVNVVANTAELLQQEIGFDSVFRVKQAHSLLLQSLVDKSVVDKTFDQILGGNRWLVGAHGLLFVGAYGLLFVFEGRLPE